jgi:hypothetical protein
MDRGDGVLDHVTLTPLIGVVLGIARVSRLCALVV